MSSSWSGFWKTHFTRLLTGLQLIFNSNGTHPYDLDYSLRSPQMFVVSFGATLLIATLSFTLLERPITNLKDKIFRVSSS
jgi:peptidoglycan/LPS O-acetylase OafA/YrhL